MTVPLKLIISPLTAEASDIGYIFTSESTRNLFAGNSDKKLSVFLMYEKVKGKLSFYSPYINVICNPDSIILWDEEICKEFQDENLIKNRFDIYIYIYYRCSNSFYFYKNNLDHFELLITKVYIKTCFWLWMGFLINILLFSVLYLTFIYLIFVLNVCLNIICIYSPSQIEKTAYTYEVFLWCYLTVRARYILLP